MHVAPSQLKPLSSIQLSTDETKMLGWIRSAGWEAQTGAREPIPYKTKVPEFFSGTRLYNVKAGGSQSPLELFIKKLQFQGVLTKQDMYPLTTEGNAKFLCLKKADLENLGVGQDEEEE